MKYALITGTSRRIGKDVGLNLSKMGNPVILNYLKNAEVAKKLANTIKSNGGRAKLLPSGASNPKAIEATPDNQEQAHPNDYISTSLNNAGIRHDNVMFMTGDDYWHKMPDTTLNGFFYVTRQLLKKIMPLHRKGSIINMVPLSSVKGLSRQTNYNSSKTAIIGATKALSQKVGAKTITVNALAPGFIETDITKDFSKERLTQKIPFKHFVIPEGVVELVEFIFSNMVSYIPGEVININNGLYT